MKMKKLNLMQEQIEETKYQYRVAQVVNHTKPKIGDVLTEREANTFCRDINWTVTIKAALS